MLTTIESKYTCVRRILHVSAYDVARSKEIKQVLMNYEKRLCVIVCDELGKRYNTNVFSTLKIDEYL